MIKKLTIITTLITTMFLSGCDESKDKAIEVAKNEVKSLMDDPRSAVFSEIKAVTIDKNIRDYIICGKLEGQDKRGKDIKNEFAVNVYGGPESESNKFGILFFEMKYNFSNGLLNKDFYNLKYACTDGAEAYLKKPKQ